MKKTATPYNAYITVSRKYRLYKGIKLKGSFTSRSCHMLVVELLETSGDNPDEGPSGERSKNKGQIFGFFLSNFYPQLPKYSWSYGTNFHTKFHSFVALSFQAYYCYH